MSTYHSNTSGKHFSSVFLIDFWRRNLRKSFARPLFKKRPTHRHSLFFNGFLSGDNWARCGPRLRLPQHAQAHKIATQEHATATLRAQNRPHAILANLLRLFHHHLPNTQMSANTDVLGKNNRPLLTVPHDKTRGIHVLPHTHANTTPASQPRSFVYAPTTRTILTHTAHALVLPRHQHQQARIRLL